MSPGARFSALLSILLILAFPAHAHVDKTTGQDYRDFTRNDGLGSCCDWHDCRPAHAPFAEPDGEMITDLGNNKYRFDPSKVVKRPSDDGNWHVCGDGRKLRCIIAPVQSLRDPGGFDGLVGWSSANDERLARHERHPSPSSSSQSAPPLGDELSSPAGGEVNPMLRFASNER